MLLKQWVDALPHICAKRGGPLRRRAKLHIYKGYDFSRCGLHLKNRDIKDHIARKAI